jgi:hypothetical protein
MANKRQREQKERKRVSSTAAAKDRSQGYEETAVKYPDGFPQYKLEPGVHQIDIMPYIVGEDNPKADKGYECGDRLFTIHRIPTPDGKTYNHCCPAKSWAAMKSCPCCKLLAANPGSSDNPNPLYGQDRILYVVNDKPGKAKNPLKILNVAYRNRKQGFGEQLTKAILSMSRRKGEDIFIYDLKEGYTVEVEVANTKYKNIERIDLIPRDYEYPDTMIEKSPCLDDCLIAPDLAKIKKMLAMGSGEDDDEDTDDEEPESTHKSSTKATKKKDEDDDLEDEDDDTDDSDLEDDDDLDENEDSDLEDEDDEDSDDDSDLDESEEEEKPTPKKRGRPAKKETEKKTPSKKSKKQEEEEEDEDDLDIDDDDDSDLDESEEEEEKPAPKKKGRK